MPNSGETGKLKTRKTNVVENWREGKTIWREHRRKRVQTHCLYYTICGKQLLKSV